MAIIWFVLGFIFGLLFKIIMDKYHNFKTEEEKRADKMEELLVNWQAIAKLKNLDNK